MLFSIDRYINHKDDKIRLGSLLIKKGLLTDSQLNQALHFQKVNNLKLGKALVTLKFITPSSLKAVLIRQSWLKTLAAVGTFMFAPLASNVCFATEGQHRKAIEVASLESSQSPFKKNMQVSFSPVSIDEQSKAYYFSGHENFANGDSRFFILGKHLSDRSGLSLSLFTKSNNQTQSYDWKISSEKFDQNTSSAPDYLRFDPQISLFKYTVKPSKFSFNKRKIKSGNRYTNTTPAVIMLTLKGRSIYETAGDQTKFWSLNRAKKGVQRKAQLMLSITKQF